MRCCNTKVIGGNSKQTEVYSFGNNIPFKPVDLTHCSVDPSGYSGRIRRCAVQVLLEFVMFFLKGAWTQKQHSGAEQVGIK